VALAQDMSIPSSARPGQGPAAPSCWHADLWLCPVLLALASHLSGCTAGTAMPETLAATTTSATSSTTTFLGTTGGISISTTSSTTIAADVGSSTTVITETAPPTPKPTSSTGPSAPSAVPTAAPTSSTGPMAPSAVPTASPTSSTGPSAPSAEPTPNYQDFAEECYGELDALTVDEGEGVGDEISTASSAECMAGCSANANCMSFTLCPQLNGCWLKDKSFSGGEPSQHYSEGLRPSPSAPHPDSPAGWLACIGGWFVGWLMCWFVGGLLLSCYVCRRSIQFFHIYQDCLGKGGKTRSAVCGHVAGPADFDCSTFYKRSCSPTRAPTPAPTLSPDTAPYCGIAVDVYACREEVARLEAIDPAVGSSFGQMCMGYGGTHPQTWDGLTAEDRDMCTLNINNDCSHWYQDLAGAWQCAADYGLSKNPAECDGHYFFLWDEPMTQGLSAEWAADQWKAHVNTWTAEIETLRTRGTRVTSPLFTDHGGAAQDKLLSFFARCGPECSNPASPYYVDLVATNQWLLNPSSDHAIQEEWIKSQVAAMRQANGDRPVVLGNFAWLGASTADQAADAIARSRIWDPSWSGLEAVFYFAATDYGGNTLYHRLSDTTSSGSTVGAALVERCRAYGR
ncbi:unnamed protein product, partial [Prorocentrum cordatum]